MRISKTVSITLPPEMLSRALALAEVENRTMSELVREALRQYERRREWGALRDYAQETAAMRGLSEGDIAATVKKARGALWPGYKKRKNTKPKSKR